MEFKHVSVLLDESLQYLNIDPSGTYLDGTLGGAGHSSEILKRLEDGLLIGMDLDDKALEYSLEKLKAIDGNFVLAKGNFSNIKMLMEELEVDGLDGVLLDLGVSSYQLDTPERGFSYNYDAPLDMRMDQSQSLSAMTIVNTYTPEEIERILKENAEERWAKRIAEFIVEYRPIHTTFELVDVIKKAIPVGARDDKHPAKRTFQALRIAVNQELSIIEQTIKDVVELLNPGGRLVVITFHSLEDRLVKHTFKELEKSCVCPPEFPTCQCDKVSEVKILTRKPVLPSYRELEFNNRSHSAKLRAVEKR